MGWRDNLKRVIAAGLSGGTSELGRLAGEGSAAHIITDPFAAAKALSNDKKTHTSETTDSEGNKVEETEANDFNIAKAAIEAYVKEHNLNEQQHQALIDYVTEKTKDGNYNMQDLISGFEGQYKEQIKPITENAQANADAASEAETSAINTAIQQRQAGINAGVGRARAGLLGDSSANNASYDTQRNAYTANIQNQGATQADYLNKMGQVTALQNQANNMQQGALWNSAGAAVQGFGSGASLGASLGS